MVYRRRDLQLARRAKRAGAKHSLRIILEARRAGIPISLAFALVEQESNFENIFGHDAGAWRPRNGKVTRASVKELLRRVSLGGASNGIGLTQLTWPGYIRMADARPGGAARVANQLRVGFTILSSHIHASGTRGGLARYNAGDPWSLQGRRYAASVLDRQKKWHRVLTRS